MICKLNLIGAHEVKLFPYHGIQGGEVNEGRYRRSDPWGQIFYWEVNRKNAKIWLFSFPFFKFTNCKTDDIK